MRKLSRYGKLNKLYKETVASIEEWKRIADRLENKELKIVKALFGETYRSKSTEEIIVEISNLRGQVKGMERIMRDIEGSERSIYQENAKLWYLVRAITKDPTLSNEAVNHEEQDPRFLGKKKSPFDRPNF